MVRHLTYNDQLEPVCICTELEYENVHNIHHNDHNISTTKKKKQ